MSSEPSSKPPSRKPPETPPSHKPPETPPSLRLLPQSELEKSPLYRKQQEGLASTAPVQHVQLLTAHKTDVITSPGSKSPAFREELNKTPAAKAKDSQANPASSTWKSEAKSLS